MKKISFGSFPLTEIRPGDRKCLDRYLIKTFSDNISISDAIRNLAVTKNLLYITPDSLMQYWLKIKKNADEEVKNDRVSNSLYDQALKRAFFVLKEFYKKIKNAPFYKDFIYYPIYIENIEKINALGNKQTDSQYTEVLYNYSFIILANDLTKDLKIDEIRYDENASLNFLFLFVEFFSGPEFNLSIHDFNKTDYEFLVKLYQFVEKTGKDPIHVVIDLYKLLGEVKKAVQGKEKNPLTFERNINSIDNKLFKKYAGMLRHKLVELAKKTSGHNVSASDKKLYREAFINIMENIFKSEELSGLYSGVSENASRAERLNYVYTSNKYHEILTLAKELIAYNELDCQKIITQDPMDFDFRVEAGDVTIETQRHVLSQKYQTFFKTYVESISTYLESIIETILKSINIEKTVNAEMKKQYTDYDEKYKRYSEDLQKVNDQLEKIDRLRKQFMREAEIAEQNGDPAAQQEAIDKIRFLEQKEATLQNQKKTLLTYVDQLETFLAEYKNYEHKTNTAIKILNKELIGKIRDSLMSSIANDLTFVYDDGKTFFTDDLIAEGFMKLISSKPFDIINPEDFDKVATKADDPSTFPPTIDVDGFKKPNPEYYAAQVVKSLNTTFGVMAEDVITALEDNLRPALQTIFLDKIKSADKNYAEYLQKIFEKLMRRIDPNTGEIKRLSPSYKDNLENQIFQNRFIHLVLAKFKQYFSMHEVKKKIEYNERISQLHPLIKKLMGKDRRCNYFKSFIIEYETVEQLYRVKYLVDTEKFLAGIINNPPRKFNNPMNRLQEVLNNYLGLTDNPTWIISKQNVYLSMPDDFSLTRTGILSKIPKKDLMKVCRIKEADYWNQQTMGKVAQFGNKKIAELYKKIDKIRDEISDLEKRKIKETNSKKKKSIEGEIRAKNSKIEKIENEISKLKQDEKNYHPNAFIFGNDSFDDPNQAEKNELLSDAEKTDLSANRDKIREKLLALNPYDETEVDKLENQLKKIRETHPFDFENEETDEEREKSNEFEEKARETNDKVLSELERLLKEREKRYSEENNINRF